LNCPNLQSLPKVFKQIFLAPEPNHSDQPAAHRYEQKSAPSERKTGPMTVSSNRPLTFGDFVAGVYHAWGARRAKGIIDLAIKAHVIEFRGKERFVIS
jgi:hypothetical protein